MDFILNEQLHLQNDYFNKIFDDIKKQLQNDYDNLNKKIELQLLKENEFLKKNWKKLKNNYKNILIVMVIKDIMKRIKIK